MLFRASRRLVVCLCGAVVPGAGVMVQIKAGQSVDDDLQQQLDDRCK